MIKTYKTILKEKIEKSGLKQKFIAAFASITEQTLSKIVKGKIKPSYKTAEKIAKSLNCNPDDIFLEK